MDVYLPYLVGILIVTLIVYKLAQWAEEKRPGLGQWITVIFILAGVMITFRFAFPTFELNIKNAFFQFFLLIAIVVLAVSWKGLAKITEPPPSSHTKFIPASPIPHRSSPTQSHESSSNPEEYHYTEEDIARLNRDGEDKWDRIYSDQSDREREEKREEEAQRSEDAYWEERREIEEQRSRDADIADQKQWEEEQQSRNDDED